MIELGFPLWVSALLPSDGPSSVFSPDSARRPPEELVLALPRTPKAGMAALAADFSDTAPSPACD